MQGPVYLSSQTITGVNVIANSPTKLQILMPDETPMDGSLNGKTITQAHQTAGAAFSVTARLTDNYWNNILLSQPTVQLSLTDTYGTVDGQSQYTVQKQLSAGAIPFNVALFTASTQTITVSESDGLGFCLYPTTNTVAFTVNPQAASKLLVLNPGESFQPGKFVYAPWGKGNNNPSGQMAGVPFTVTVYSCDAYYNVSSTNVYAWIGTSNSSDNYASFSPSSSTLVSFSTFTVVLRTAQNTFVRTYHTGDQISLADYQYGTYSNAPIVVSPNTAHRLQVLVQGEFANPGSPTGKTGQPTYAVAGCKPETFNSYYATVNLVDDYYNKINTGSLCQGLWSLAPTRTMARYRTEEWTRHTMRFRVASRCCNGNCSRRPLSDGH
jgi:hypothetical protein